MMFSLHRVAGWPPPAPLLRPPIRHPAWVAVPRPLSILAAARVESASSSSFDPEAFEAERLRLDAEARASMAAAAAATSEESAGEGGDPKAWKWKIRKRVWDLMEAENIARNPRPVHHRIPNFDGAAVAADALGKLDVFEKAQCVKVNPDSPQKQVRFLTLTGLTLVVLNKGNHGNRWRILVNNISRFVSDSVEPIDEVILTCSMELTGLTLVVLNKGNHGNRWHILVNNIVMVNAGGKKLLTPQPRLRTGFFSVLESKTLPSGSILEACTSVGAAKYGRPIGLDEKIKVDLIVIGSVAVDPRTGARLGKGEGFAELEYGMLRYMEAIDDNTMIVTSVHDKQLVSDIPVEKLLVHDVPVDIICTPTQIIYTDTTIPKPQGIYWDKLSPEKLGQIRILRELKKRIERETGQVLPTGPSEKLPPTARRRR